MISFITRRIGYGFLVLFGVLSIVFFIFNILPGDPARMMLGQRADQEAIDEINRELGLDKSLFSQYLLYLNDLSPISFHSDKPGSSSYYSSEKYGGVSLLNLSSGTIILKKPYLRKSYQSQKRVADVLFESLPETAVLAIAAIFIASILGILLGIVTAIYKDSWVDQLFLFLATSGMALPSFFVGILFAWIFGFLLVEYTGLPMTGSLYEVDDLGRGEYISWVNLVLPALTLGIRPLAVIIQLSRNSLLEVLSRDYIRTAKAKGLTSRVILFKHALKNAMNPIITAISGMFASLMAGAVFVEIIFSWKGIGWELVNALEKYDLPIVMGAVLIIALIFVLINLIVDLLYGWLDPRVRI